MKNLVFNTSTNWGATTLRLVLGIILFSHGAGAMLGWFGGYGFSATVQALTTFYALPWLVAAAVISIQFFGAIMLITGFATRIASVGIIGIFIGMAINHIDNGLHMNWAGTKPGEGFEYHLLVMAMCVALVVFGGGSFSLDRKLVSKSN